MVVPSPFWPTSPRPHDHSVPFVFNERNEEFPAYTFAQFVNGPTLKGYIGRARASQGEFKFVVPHAQSVLSDVIPAPPKYMPLILVHVFKVPI